MVQHIGTRWTKRSRGGPEAALRNALPEATRLPQSLLHRSELSLVCHRISNDERYGFSAPPCEELIENSTLVPVAVGCVEIGRYFAAPTLEQFYMKFKYDQRYGGAPDRSWVEKSLVLDIGQWGQIVYNGRFSAEEGGWWYEKTVVNVGLVPAPLTSTALFTRGEPNERFLATGHLL